MSRKVIPLHARPTSHLYREPVYDPTGTDPAPPIVMPQPETVPPWLQYAGWILAFAFGGALLGLLLPL